MNPFRLACPASLILLTILALPTLPARVQAQSYTALTTDPASDRHPDVTPDGQTIVFESNRSGLWRLYRMTINGTQVTPLTTDGPGDNHPGISPDGQTVVFLRGPIDPTSGSIDYSQICTIPLAGGAVTAVTPENVYQQDEMPSWSPDGTTIYFSRRYDGDYTIYSVPATGGPGTLLIDHGNGDNRPMVSPDGLHLTYYRRPSTSAPLNIWEALLSDVSVRTQVTTETKNTAGADYTADGLTLLYSSRKGNNQQELWELKRSTGEHTQVTFDGANGAPDPQNLWARYHPMDDDRIIFSSRRITGDSNIWVLDRTAPPLPTNHLHVDDAVGLPGGVPIPVTVTLLNDVSIRGLEFRLTDTPEAATVTGATGTGRGAAFDADFEDAGAAHLLAWTPANQAITPGVGAVIELLVQIAPGTPLGNDINLGLSDVVLIDAAGAAHDVSLEGGVIHLARRPGDLNGDNRTDAGDLVRLVDIILGRGTPPNVEELEVADCHDDAALDVADVVCLSDLIIPPGSGEVPTAPGALEVLQFNLTESIRAIELDFPPGTAIEEAASGLGPLTTRAWIRPNGAVAFLAWDPSGRALEPATIIGLPSAAAPIAARAWSDGGRSLLVTREGRRLTIGGEAAPPAPVVSGAPNPFSDATTIRFQVSRPGTTTIELFDVRGALRRRWTRNGLATGEQAWSWDGRDDQGEPVASGIYLARVALPDGEHHLRLVRLNR